MMAKAPLRISLFGGGSDLPMYRELTGSGGCVLSCTIDRHVTAKYVRDKPFAAHGDVLPGSGLGGSGAACVALAKLRTATSGHELFQEAWAMEVEGNRYAGWQDVAASAWGGLNLFTFKEDLIVEPIAIPPGLDARLLLFSTGITRQATPILEAQSQDMRHKLDGISRSIALAHQAATWLEGGKIDIGGLLHEAWAEKREREGVETYDIAKAYNAALWAGASGGKLCGAGGGGYLLFYAEPDAQASVRAAMAGLGMDELVFHLTAQGASLI